MRISSEKPITIKSAGDGEVIFDGAGNHRLFEIMASKYHIFDGLTIRDTDVAIFAGQKAELIHAMKAASLEGFQLASFVTVGASVACAVAVAFFLPWSPHSGDAVLLAWRNNDEPDSKTARELPSTD